MNERTLQDVLDQLVSIRDVLEELLRRTPEPRRGKAKLILIAVVAALLVVTQT